MYLVGIPLLVIPFVIYNIIEFLMPGATIGVIWTLPAAVIRLASGVDWTLTWGDIFLTFSVLLLFVEMVKSSRVSARSIMDHLLSTVLSVIMLIEFLLMKQAATSTFFLLMVISFVDMVGGFSVTIRSAQRSMAVDQTGTIQRL